MEELIEAAKKLANKAAEAEDSGDAMRFSQAASNVSNANAVLEETKKRAG